MVKSSATWAVAASSFCLDVLLGFEGYFWRKMATFGRQLRTFGRDPPDLAPPPRAARGYLLHHNLDLARSPPRLQDCEGRRKPEAIGIVFVACCLLLLLVS